jgi:hypothetical protein
MVKLVTALSAALILGWALVGSASTANAGYRHHGCCGPLPPSYTYKTKKVYKYIKRYSDVYRTKYVKRIKRHYYVTRIQPIYHIHKVKRVHTKLVGVVHPVRYSQIKYLPPKKYYTSSVVYLKPKCACSSGGYGQGGHGGYGGSGGYGRSGGY